MLNNKHEPSELIKRIFSQNDELRATVETHTLTTQDKATYEPVLLGIRDVGDYNNFHGPAVAEFLRSRLAVDEGPITSIRFGRDYSPVLYLGIYFGERGSEADRKTYIDQLIREIDVLKPDTVTFQAPRTIYVWWD